MRAAAFTQSLRTLLRRNSPGSYGHIQKLEGVPFYEARPPWWARFTWGLIAADLLVTSTMTELTWTKWTLPPSKPGDEPVLRPAWQRAGLSLAHFSLGIGFATLLLIARSRVARILHILPASDSAPKQLLIAGAHRHDVRGAVVPFARTHIEPGRDNSEIILRIQDVHGHWWIGLTRGRLRGVSVPTARLRDAFMTEWGIRKKVHEGIGSGRWKSGPVLGN